MLLSVNVTGEAIIPGEGTPSDSYWIPGLDFYDLEIKNTSLVQKIKNTASVNETIEDLTKENSTIKFNFNKSQYSIEDDDNLQLYIHVPVNDITATFEINNKHITEKTSKDNLFNLSIKGSYLVEGDNEIIVTSLNYSLLFNDITAVQIRGKQSIIGEEGYYSLGIGRYNTINAQESQAIGYNNTLENTSIYSTTIGTANLIQLPKSFACGENNKILIPTEENLGEYTDPTKYSGMFVEGLNNTVTGFAAHAQNRNNTAIGHYSHVGGYNSIASGKHSFAHGNNVKALGENSFATGASTQAIAANSFSLGCESKVEYNDTTNQLLGGAMALGYKSVTRHRNSVALGHTLYTDDYNQLVIGKYNAHTENNSGNLFVIGNGTKIGSESNALTVHTNGTTTTKNLVATNQIQIGNITLTANELQQLKDLIPQQ